MMIERSRWLPASAVLCVGLVAGVLGAGIGRDPQAALAVSPAAAAIVMILFSVPVVRLVSKDPTVRTVIAAGLVLKLGGAILRYQVNQLVFGTQADAGFYHQAGTEIAELLGADFIGPGDARISYRGSGTTNLAYAIGWLYRVTGPNILVGFLTMSWIGFLGMICFFRAAVESIPDIDQRRLAVFTFFVPTMIYWPSSLGKEAWMIGFLGLAALGVSGVLRHEYSLRTFATLGIGFVGSGWIRPHLAALTAAALALAFMWPGRVQPAVPGRRRRARLLGVVVAAALVVVALGQVASFFDETKFQGEETETLGDILDVASGRSSQGGSEFSPTPASGPLSLPPAIVTVIFRPFPFEADSVVQLATSIEGLALAILLITSTRRLRSVPNFFNRSGYVRFALAYTIGFVIAFSYIANFGLLARQRAQLFPILLIFLALPEKRRLPPERAIEPLVAVSSR